MTARDDILDQELQDTLDRDRARKRRPAAPVAELAHDLVATPRGPRVGVCVYCGSRAVNARVCAACDDLPDLDAA